VQVQVQVGIDIVVLLVERATLIGIAGLHVAHQLVGARPAQGIG
jgi:hypothetical protein